MSHSFKLEGFTFISEDDENILESNVLIKREHPEEEMEVPGSYLLRFVADYLSRKKISELERMGFKDMLGTK